MVYLMMMYMGCISLTQIQICGWGWLGFGFLILDFFPIFLFYLKEHARQPLAIG